MKKLSKTLLSIAAVSAVSAALAASAMAADLTADYTAGETNGSVAIGEIGAHGDQITMLIVKGETGTEATEANIVAIDQTGDATTLATVPVKKLEDGTYEVRIGGTEGEIQKVTFTVGDTPIEGTDIVIGDVNFQDGVNGTDGVMIARYIAKSTKNSGYTGEEYTKTADNSTVVIGDVNFQDGVNGTDGVMVARFIARSTKNSGSTGETVTVNAK